MASKVIKTYTTVHRRYEGALKAFSRRPTPRAYRDFLRYSFAHNMSILRVLKGQKNIDKKSKLNIIEDNKVVLNMLTRLRFSNPELFDPPAPQISFTRELVSTIRGVK